MNKARREKLVGISKNLSILQEHLENILQAEQMGFDNLSEGLQQTMRGNQMEEAVSNLEIAVESICDAIIAIEEASR